MAKEPPKKLTKKKLSGGQWKKGQTGNPKGRPPRNESMAELIRALIDIQDQEIKQKNGHKKYIDRKTAIAEKIVAMAIEGYYPAMRDIVKITDNTPLRVQHVDSDGNTITPVASAGIMIVEKMRLDEWEKLQAEHEAKQKKSAMSGSRSQGKRTPSPAQPLNSSSEAPKEGGKATSSSGTGYKVRRPGAKPGEGS